MKPPHFLSSFPVLQDEIVRLQGLINRFTCPLPVLKKIGKVQLLARSGRLIIKAVDNPPPGAILVDEKGNKVGKVVEVLGSTKNPYVSAIPLTDRAKKVVGGSVYLL